MSITITTQITTIAYQVTSTGGCSRPASRAIACQTITRLAITRIAPSPSAERCSALPWPYWWPVSAGRAATPTAKNVSSAAIRSVPECAASESRPRLCVARPVPSFSPIRAVAASTERSAVRRCGVTGEAYSANRLERPEHGVLAPREVTHGFAEQLERRARCETDAGLDLPGGPE